MHRIRRKQFKTYDNPTRKNSTNRRSDHEHAQLMKKLTNPIQDNKKLGRSSGINIKRGRIVYLERSVKWREKRKPKEKYDLGCWWWVEDRGETWNWEN